MKLHFFVICLLLAAALPLRADQFDEVREEIQQGLHQEQIPSLAIAVAKGGEILWEEGFGWANREDRIEATEHTVYSLASISKPITATALMLLAQREQLQLDAPANQYLSGEKIVAHAGDAEDATLRRLANHTAGLPLHYQFFYADEPYEPPPFDESLRRYGILVVAPGERFQYANFGYGVLDHIISEKSGMSYADVMRREVFLPLDLTHTSVGIASGLEEHAAVCYASDQTPLPAYDFDHPGASAVFSSAHDLVRFGMFHLGQRQGERQAVLSERSIRAMQEPTADVGDGRKYGLGWFIDPDEYGYHTVSHTGGMGGVRTRLTLVPSEGIVVAVLCNFQNRLPLDITHRVLGTLLPEYGKKWRMEDDHQVNDQPASPHCPDELVGYWAGQVSTYRGPRRLELWAKPDGDIQVRLNGGLKTLLNESRLNDGELTGKFAGDIGTEDANRRPYHLHLRVKLQGEKMSGSLSAISLPGPKLGNALSHWVELERADKDHQLISLFNGHDLDGWRVLDKSDFQRHGQVRVERGAIVLEKGSPATGISLEGNPPRYDYEVSLQAKRIAGSDFFCGLTFPVGEDYLSLILGGWGGGVTGISNLDGMSAVENETTGFMDFEEDRWYDIRLRVTQEKVEAWVDDEQIVDVELADRKLSIWWEQEPVRPLGVASWYTKSALRNLRLKRL